MKNILPLFLLGSLQLSLWSQNPGAVYEYLVAPILSPGHSFQTVNYSDPLQERSVTTFMEYADLFHGRIKEHRYDYGNHYYFGLIKTGTIGYFPVHYGDDSKGAIILQWNRTLPIHNFRREESKRLVNQYYDFDQINLSYVQPIFSSLDVTLSGNFLGNDRRSLWNFGVGLGYRFYESEIGLGIHRGWNDESFFILTDDESVYTPMTANRKDYRGYFKTRYINPVELAVEWNGYTDRPRAKYDHNFSTHPQQHQSQWQVDVAYRDRMEWLIHAERQDGTQDIQLNKNRANYGQVLVPLWHWQAYETRYRYPTNSILQFVSGLGYRRAEGRAEGTIQSWPFGSRWQDALGDTYFGNWAGQLDLRTALLGMQLEVDHHKLNLNGQYVFVSGKNDYEDQKTKPTVVINGQASHREYKAYAATIEAHYRLDYSKYAWEVSASQLIPIAFQRTGENASSGYHSSRQREGGRVFRTAFRWKF